MSTKTNNKKNNVKNKARIAKAASPTKSNRGRPRSEINLAVKGKFSVESLYNRLRGKYTKMTISNHLNAALAAHKVKVVERKITAPSGRGAPRTYFAAIFRQPRAIKSLPVELMAA